MQLFSKIHTQVSFNYNSPILYTPKLSHPLSHPLYIMLTHILYTQSRPPFRYLENKFESFSFILHPIRVQNVF